MQEQRFTKKDWALFKNKIVDWQESYMNRLNNEYIELLSEDANPSEKFWRLDKRIKEDRKKTGVQLEMSRSNLIYNIMIILLNPYVERIEIVTSRGFHVKLKKCLQLRMELKAMACRLKQDGCVYISNSIAIKQEGNFCGIR